MQKRAQDDDLLPKDSRLTEQTQISAPRTSLYASIYKT